MVFCGQDLNFFVWKSWYDLVHPSKFSQTGSNRSAANLLQISNNEWLIKFICKLLISCFLYIIMQYFKSSFWVFSSNFRSASDTYNVLAIWYYSISIQYMYYRCIKGWNIHKADVIKCFIFLKLSLKWSMLYINGSLLLAFTYSFFSPKYVYESEEKKSLHKH